MQFPKFFIVLFVFNFLLGPATFSVARVLPEQCECQRIFDDIENDIPSFDPATYQNASARKPHDEMERMSCADIDREYQIYHQEHSVSKVQDENGNFISPVRYVGYDKRAGTWIIMHVKSQPAWHEVADCERTSFGPELQRMREMGARLEGNWPQYDERGHILASQLCGPAEHFNLVPQTPLLNRNVNNRGGYGWLNLENHIKRMLQCDCGTATIDVYMNYETNLHVRPSGMKVCLEFTRKDGQPHPAILPQYFNNEIYEVSTTPRSLPKDQ